LCPRAVLFRKGEVVYDGPSETAIEHHHRLLAVEGEVDSRATSDQLASGEVELTSQEVLRPSGQVAHRADQSGALRLVARLRFHTDVPSPQLLFRVLSEDGQVAYEQASPLEGDHSGYESGEEATAEVVFRPALGGGGTFRLVLVVAD